MPAQESQLPQLGRWSMLEVVTVAAWAGVTATKAAKVSSRATDK
jgi:hypothetical protein